MAKKAKTKVKAGGVLTGWHVAALQKFCAKHGVTIPDEDSFDLMEFLRTLSGAYLNLVPVALKIERDIGQLIEKEGKDSDAFGGSPTCGAMVTTDMEACPYTGEALAAESEDEEQSSDEEDGDSEEEDEDSDDEETDEAEDEEESDDDDEEETDEADDEVDEDDESEDEEDSADEDDEELEDDEEEDEEPAPKKKAAKAAKAKPAAKKAKAVEEDEDEELDEDDEEVDEAEDEEEVDEDDEEVDESDEESEDEEESDDEDEEDAAPKGKKKPGRKPSGATLAEKKEAREAKREQLKAKLPLFKKNPSKLEALGYRELLMVNSLLGESQPMKLGDQAAQVKHATKLLLKLKVKGGDDDVAEAPKKKKATVSVVPDRVEKKKLGAKKAAAELVKPKMKKRA